MKQQKKTVLQFTFLFFSHFYFIFLTKHYGPNLAPYSACERDQTYVILY